MGESFGRSVGEWAPFYAYLGGAAAALLGLLFVAVSLRLNLFRDAAVADVRDYAAQTFGQFLALVLVAALALMPDQRPAGLGLPVALLGALGVGWLVYLVRESVRVNAPADPQARWRTGIAAATLAVDAGLIGCGLALAAGHAGALPWLAVACLATLTSSVAGVWLLLSHARPA